jgi:hypothetical protein
MRRWLAAAALVASGGTLIYRNWHTEAGDEFELALGIFLFAVGGFVTLYNLAFPRH